MGVLPMSDRSQVVLVGQYRYVARGFRWEMPTGGLNPGESEQAAAQRELREEAGCEAERLVKLCVFETSKSVVDETAHLFLGEGIRPARREPDPTEFLEVRVFDFDEVLRMVARSEIRDAMTVIAVLHAARRLGR